MVTEDKPAEITENEILEANQTIALGAGVGVLGAGAAIVTGAVCPLCFVLAPGLIGAGAYQRLKLRKPRRKEGGSDGRSEG